MNGITAYVAIHVFPREVAGWITLELFEIGVRGRMPKCAPFHEWMDKLEGFEL